MSLRGASRNEPWGDVAISSFCNTKSIFALYCYEIAALRSMTWFYILPLNRLFHKSDQIIGHSLLLFQARMPRRIFIRNKVRVNAFII